MTAFALEYHANRQHWAISAALVVLVHGVVASAIATWWIAIKQPEMVAGAPIVIELAPTPPAPGPGQAAVPAPPEQGVPNIAPYQPMEKIEETIQERTAKKGEDKTEMTPAGQPSVSMAAPQSAERENKDDVRTAPGGAAAGAPQPAHSVEPIDIRMGDPFLSRLKKKPLNPSEQQRIMMGRRMLGPSRYLAGREQPLVPAPVTAEPTKPGATGGAIRNAIGVLVPAPARTHETMANRGSPPPSGGAGIARNAAGASVVPMSSAGIPISVARNAVGVVATRAVSGANPVGATAVNHPGATTSLKSVGAPGSSVATAISQHAINGTRMIRPGASTGVIGGPARSGAGVINGTAIMVR
jgi:hypothetical protein